MNYYFISIAIFYLATLQSESFHYTPQEIAANRIQERVADKIDRIKKVLIKKSKKYHNTIPILKNYTCFYASIDCDKKPAVQSRAISKTRPILNQLLIISSRYIRAPAA